MARQREHRLNGVLLNASLTRQDGLAHRRPAKAAVLQASCTSLARLAVHPRAAAASPELSLTVSASLLCCACGLYMAQRYDWSGSKDEHSAAEQQLLVRRPAAASLRYGLTASTVACLRCSRDAVGNSGTSGKVEATKSWRV
jgi:hypothetical protein